VASKFGPPPYNFKGTGPGSHCDIGHLFFFCEVSSDLLGSKSSDAVYRNWRGVEACSPDVSGFEGVRVGVGSGSMWRLVMTSIVITWCWDDSLASHSASSTTSS